MLALHYRSVLEQEGMASIMSSPGFCGTILNRGLIKLSDDAIDIVKAVMEGGIEISGRFIRGSKDIP